jgi:L-seryl-tRNA(Ser) seleniumtransferase
MRSLRSLPSVEQLLQTPVAAEWVAEYGRPLTLDAIRRALDDIRRDFPATGVVPENHELLKKVTELLEWWVAPTLQAVINATGVILHTNLGRAPLSRSAMQAMWEVSTGYSTLEFDLSKGKRGSRLVHAEALLTRVTGSEAALVVNNNAAAVLLVLTALARRRSVVIARSQLVEIGGGFRVPDVMKQSGARLVEIGTTNRVHLPDYEEALLDNPALLLRAHRSNFQIIGFTSEPELSEIAALAHQAGVPVVDDLGSGSLLDTARYGLAHEPMVQESLKAGADLVCFSGDKLLGGPQAGIVVGRADLVAKLKKHPLARAIRADKLCLAALTATLLHYLKDEPDQEIPVWRMIATPVEQIQQRALHGIEVIGMGRIVPGESTIGGGSLPGETLPTSLLALRVSQPQRFLERLRNQKPPIIARTQDDEVLIDLRTVLLEQDEILFAGLGQALST